MLQVFQITLKGVLRDRVFHGIMVATFLLLFVPQVSSLSMRIVTELSITLSLSLISFIMLLLSIFLGGTCLWRDMDRRYTYSVISLPLPRSSYYLGKFSALAVCLILVALLLGIVTYVVVWQASLIYPPGRPVVWGNIFFAILFDASKYILLIAFAFLFSTVSTSFFLPIFGAISVFMVGSATQEAYDFVHSPSGASLAPFVKNTASALYYVLPNFSAFDLNVNAVYGLPLSGRGGALTFGYFVVYTSILLAIGCLVFSRREMR